MNHGGPAFPVLDLSKTQCVGMTLRDWYAGLFAAAWVISLSRPGNEAGYDDHGCVVEANRLALEQADNMLAERSNKCPD